jgi:predicted oxidoreductase
VRQFRELGSDFVSGNTVAELVAEMNRLTPESSVDGERVAEEIGLRDRRLPGGGWVDPQLVAVQEARRYIGDRLLRVAPPHSLLDPAALPLIAVRLHLLTRKTLGGLQTDLQSRVLGPDGAPVPGLYAAGEVAGFGGGGMHGYRALEGTFLGGCLLGGRIAGRAAARELA